MINEQAEELNKTIQKNNPVIYNLLSEKGKAIFFPKKGIMTQTAEAKGAKINATIGSAFDDNGKPMSLTAIADSIKLDPNDIFPYAPSYGKSELRKKWQNLIKEKNPSLKSRISLPVVTSGITNGLSIAGYLFVNPGDKIILADKFWGNYKLIFEKAFGANLIKFNTFSEKEFDADSLSEKLTKGKQIIFLNFPNNPSGYTPTNEEAKKIIEIIKNSAENGNEILVVCDDAYFGLVYEEGIYKESLFSGLSDLHENVLAVKLDGVTKEEYSFGLRVGFMTYASKDINEETCKALESKTAGVVRGNVSNAPNISQSLILKALNSPTHQLEKTKNYENLKKRFNLIQDILKDKKYKEFFSALPHNSGFFMCIKLKNAEKVRQHLLEKYDTGVIASDNLIRIAYSGVPTDNIKVLFDNIYNACRELQ